MTDDERFSQDAIDRLTPIEPSAHLRRMVAQIPIEPQIPIEHDRSIRSWWPFENAWLPSFAMAAVAVLGLFLGRSWETSQPSTATYSVAEVSTAHGTRPSDIETPITSLETEGDEGLNSELEDLLLLATAGEFSADDWDLSRTPDPDAFEEETF